MTWKMALQVIALSLATSALTTWLLSILGIGH